MRPIALLLVFVLFAACNKQTANRNNPPQITLLSTTPGQIANGGNDTIRIAFEFFDQDGDVGSVGSLNEPTNIFFFQTYDSTTGESLLPVIPPEFQDPDAGIKGVASISIPTVFFTLDSAHLQTGDTFFFEIKIKDRAGNESNTIRTNDIFIKP